MQARVAAVERLPMERVNAGADAPFWRGFGRGRPRGLGVPRAAPNLVRKELKVKYKDSFLGFLWSLLRPMFQLAVYYVAIGKFLGDPLPAVPRIFLFTGLVAWTLFTDIVGGCTGAIVGNAGLIKKVYFPRELLPLSVVGAALVNFAMQLLVLVGRRAGVRRRAARPAALAAAAGPARPAAVHDRLRPVPGRGQRHVP